jgi:hypothetical protein
MKPYHELSQTIKHEVRNLEHLYHERSALTDEREALSAERAAISDDLLDARNNASDIAKLAKDLESKDRDLRKLNAILQALDKRILTAEDQFHELVPKACHTFTRLLQHFKTLIHDRQVEMLQALIHPSFRKQHEASIEILAETTTEFWYVSQIQIPSGNVWSLTRELIPEARVETLQFVRTVACALTNSADELLAELDKLGEAVQLPEFVLGALPEPIPERPAALPAIDFEQEWQSQGEREFILQLCKEAGKDLKTLSDSEKLVLQNSLINYRSQLQVGTKMGYTNWDGSQS